MLYMAPFLLLILQLFHVSSVPLSTQSHIALIPPHQISISWVTDEAYANNEPIAYLSSIKPTHQNITNNSTKIIGYTQANVNLSRYYHHVITPPLTPMTQYWYQPGLNASIYSFVARDTKSRNNTHNHNHNNNPMVKFLVYGDLGVQNANNTVKLIKHLTNSSSSTPSTSVDFIVHIGDIAYADDRSLIGSAPDYVHVYDKWGTMMQPIFSNTPYMTGPGNHEQTCHAWSDMGCHNDLRNFTVYRQYFRMPSSFHNETGGGPFNMYWSMNYKNIHIVHISTETDYPEAGPFGDQIKFVEQDLEAAYNDENISWIIVVGHRPYYTTEFYEGGGTDWPPQTPLVLRDAFEHLFYKYNVDLYVAGHVHGYERDYAVYNEQITSRNYSNPLSTVYFTIGSGGSIEGHSSTVPTDKIKGYTAVYDHRNFGVAQISVLDNTHLLWEFIGAANRSIIDSVTITKGHWV